MFPSGFLDDVYRVFPSEAIRITSRSVSVPLTLPEFTGYLVVFVDIIFPMTLSPFVVIVFLFVSGSW